MLKDERDAAPLRRNAQQVSPVEFQRSAVCRFQAGDDSQKRGFAGAAGAQNDQRFTVGDAKRHAVEAACLRKIGSGQRRGAIGYG